MVTVVDRAVADQEAADQGAVEAVGAYPASGVVGDVFRGCQTHPVFRPVSSGDGSCLAFYAYFISSPIT